jgi:hypothetical protein
MINAELANQSLVPQRVVHGGINQCHFMMKMYLVDNGSIRTDTWCSVMQNNKCHSLQSNKYTAILLNAQFLVCLGYSSYILSFIFCHSLRLINPLTPELNPSAQRCVTRFFIVGFAS